VGGWSSAVKGGGRGTQACEGMGTRVQKVETNKGESQKKKKQDVAGQKVTQALGKGKNTTNSPPKSQGGLDGQGKSKKGQQKKKKRKRMEKPQQT